MVGLPRQIIHYGRIYLIRRKSFNDAQRAISDFLTLPGPILPTPFGYSFADLITSRLYPTPGVLQSIDFFLHPPPTTHSSLDLRIKTAKESYSAD